MRKTLSTAALVLAIGLAGPTPLASATSGSMPNHGNGSGDGPVMVATCVVTNDCVPPKPKPDPTRRFPSPTDELVLDKDDDPCEILGICPPDDDEPGLNPELPTNDADDFTLEPPCPTHGDCGGGDDDDDGTDDGTDDGDDTNDGDDGTDDGDDTNDGDDEDTNDGGDDENTDDDDDTDDNGGENDDDTPDPGDSGTDIDTPRPGNPNFTG